MYISCKELLLTYEDLYYFEFDSHLGIYDIASVIFAALREKVLSQDNDIDFFLKITPANLAKIKTFKKYNHLLVHDIYMSNNIPKRFEALDKVNKLRWSFSLLNEKLHLVENIFSSQCETLVGYPEIKDDLSTFDFEKVIVLNFSNFIGPDVMIGNFNWPEVLTVSYDLLDESLQNNSEFERKKKFFDMTERQCVIFKKGDVFKYSRFGYDIELSKTYNGIIAAFTMLQNYLIDLIETKEVNQEKFDKTGEIEIITKKSKPVEIPSKYRILTGDIQKDILLGNNWFDCDNFKDFDNNIESAFKPLNVVGTGEGKLAPLPDPIKVSCPNIGYEEIIPPSSFLPIIEENK